MKEIGNSLETLCVEGHGAPPQEGNSIYGTNACEHSRLPSETQRRSPAGSKPTGEGGLISSTGNTRALISQGKGTAEKQGDCNRVQHKQQSQSDHEALESREVRLPEALLHAQPFSQGEEDPKSALLRRVILVVFPAAQHGASRSSL